ncbi:hypothetical protein BASA83_013393 [Batrachochytrium salamandrivorans]|nr:hypothetical protein BASA83_013393 [Batrachochytrium salamandrivorans]
MMNYGSPFETIYGSRKFVYYLKESGVREITRFGISHHSLPHTDQRMSSACMPRWAAINTLTQGRPDRWDEYLQQTVFIASPKHAVTKQSPFYLLYGVHPRLPGDDGPIKETMAPLDDVELNGKNERN